MRRKIRFLVLVVSSVLLCMLYITYHSRHVTTELSSPMDLQILSATGGYDSLLMMHVEKKHHPTLEPRAEFNMTSLYLDVFKTMPRDLKIMGRRLPRFWYTKKDLEIPPQKPFKHKKIYNASEVKLIYGATETYLMLWEEMLNFEGCPYDNCIVRGSVTHKHIEEADVVLYYYRVVYRYPELTWQQRSKQHWVLYADESPGYSFNLFNPKHDGKYNLTMTFRRDSDLYYPFGKTTERLNPAPVVFVNKTKGAFVYISNCGSVYYKRLMVIRQLAKYIDVDMFGGCSKKFPCQRNDLKCEQELHKDYHFYLSFENSLCKDYISEKFWDRLGEDSQFVPVAIGGLGVEEYEKVAPPNSFIHGYNFTSVKKLGTYLRYLMDNKSEYNKYHEWREKYYILRAGYFNSCKLCELANTKTYKPAIENVSQWWNNTDNCRALNKSYWS